MSEADLRMFSMFGRTSPPPQKRASQKHNFFFIFLQNGNKSEILKWLGNKGSSTKCRWWLLCIGIKAVAGGRRYSYIRGPTFFSERAPLGVNPALMDVVYILFYRSIWQATKSADFLGPPTGSGCCAHAKLFFQFPWREFYFLIGAKRHQEAVVHCRSEICQSRYLPLQSDAYSTGESYSSRRRLGTQPGRKAWGKLNWV